MLTSEFMMRLIWDGANLAGANLVWANLARANLACYPAYSICYTLIISRCDYLMVHE